MLRSVVFAHAPMTPKLPPEGQMLILECKNSPKQEGASVSTTKALSCVKMVTSTLPNYWSTASIYQRQALRPSFRTWVLHQECMSDWGLRAKGPSKTSQPRQEQQHERVSLDPSGGRHPPSTRISKRDRQPFKPYNPWGQWLSGQGGPHRDQRQFGDQRQSQGEPNEGERREKTEWQ